MKIKGSSKCDLHYSSLSRENLAFSVAYFTSAHELSLHHCYAENIRGFDKLKGTLRVLSFEGQSKSITTVLANGGELSIRESLNKLFLDSAPWEMLTRVNFTKSKLQKVDLNMRKSFLFYSKLKLFRALPKPGKLEPGWQQADRH